MKHAIALLEAIIVTAILAVPCIAATVNKDEWAGIYNGATKVGWVHTTVKNIASEGEPVYLREQVGKVRYRFMDSKIGVDWTWTMQIDSKMRPVESTISAKCAGEGSMVTSPPYDVLMKERFDGRKTVVTMSIRGKTSTEAFEMPAGYDPSGYCAYLLGSKPPTIGSQMESWHIQISKMAIANMAPDFELGNRVKISFPRKERLALGGQTHEAYVVVLEYPKCTLTRWQSADGTLLKQTCSSDRSQLSWQQETRSGAEAFDKTEGPDFSKLTLVGTVPDLVDLEEVTLCIKGMPSRSFAVSDTRQSCTFSDEDGSAVYHIRPVSFNPSASVAFPVQDRGYEKWLKATAGIEANDQSILKQAQAVVDKAPSAYVAANWLRMWVCSNIEATASSSTSISAVSTLKSKEGESIHHTVLYTALARSVGIPTRIAYGCGCENNTVMFHVWPESYVGDWISMDPRTCWGGLSPSVKFGVLDDSTDNVEDLSIRLLKELGGRLCCSIVDSKKDEKLRDAVAQLIKNAPRDQWLAIQIGNTKVGYTHIEVTSERQSGQLAYRKKQTSVMSLSKEKGKAAARWTYTLSADQSLCPVKSEFSMTFLRGSITGSVTKEEHQSTAVYKPEALLLSDTDNGKTTERSAPPSDPRLLRLACCYDFGATNLPVGTVVPLPYIKVGCIGFSGTGHTINVPLLSSSMATVMRHEQIAIGGQKRDALVVLERDGVGDTWKWVLSNGEVVKQECRAQDTVTWVSCTREEAMQIEKSDRLLTGNSSGSDK